MNITIIGTGYVGLVTGACLADVGNNVLCIDVNETKIERLQNGTIPIHEPGLDVMVTRNIAAGRLMFSSSYATAVAHAQTIFIAVGTPSGEDGSADLSIVEGALKELATARAIGERIAVVKSTIPPGSTEKWNEMFKDTRLRVVFNPEFLTERTALDDMRNQDRIILGGPRPWINKVKQIFGTAFPNARIIKTSSTTAEMVKYLTNNFLTVKVAFANEMLQICEALDKTGLNVDYDKVVEYASHDERIGPSHWAVPGPDGHMGYGGSCFCKDINAMIKIADNLLIDTPVLDGAWKKNLEVRPERDWEQLIGRAVSAKNK